MKNTTKLTIITVLSAIICAIFAVIADNDNDSHIPFLIAYAFGFTAVVSFIGVIAALVIASLRDNKG